MDNKIKIDKNIPIPLHMSSNFGLLDIMDIEDSFSLGKYDGKVQCSWGGIVSRYKKIKGNEDKRFSIRKIKHLDKDNELRIWRVK